MAHSACQAAAAAAMTWAVAGRRDQLHRCCISYRCACQRQPNPDPPAAS